MLRYDATTRFRFCQWKERTGRGCFLRLAKKIALTLVNFMSFQHIITRPSRFRYVLDPFIDRQLSSTYTTDAVDHLLVTRIRHGPSPFHTRKRASSCHLHSLPVRLRGRRSDRLLG